MSTQLLWQRRASGPTSGRAVACCTRAGARQAAALLLPPPPPLRTRGCMSAIALSAYPHGSSTSASIVASTLHQHDCNGRRFHKPHIGAATAAAAAKGDTADDAEVTAPSSPHLPPGDFSRIKKATFISSAVDLKGCPPDGRFAEFAVIGRSNVGKSSLINMLTGSDKLARVSKEPGMTKTINHYLINDSWYLVDLPGYGYAKTSQKTAASWLGFTKDYFLQRDALVAVLLLVDASIPPQPLDLECADWLASSEVPFAVVFTKTDSKKKSGPSPAQNMAAFKKGLLEEWESLPSCFSTSSKEGKGKSEVLTYLASLRRLAAEEGS